MVLSAQQRQNNKKDHRRQLKSVMTDFFSLVKKNNFSTSNQEYCQRGKTTTVKIYTQEMPSWMETKGFATRCKPQQVQTTSYTQDQEGQITPKRLENI